jgi:NitT/TauT family transport system permease protein
MGLLRMLGNKLATPLVFGVILVVWKVYVEMFDVSAFVLPPPERIGVAILTMVQQPRTWYHTWVTLQETLAGFGFALVFGVIIGAALGRIAWLERVLKPVIIALQVIPKIALVPLFVMWFGFGMTSKIVIAAVLAFFPIMTNTLLGVKSVPEGHLDLLRSLNASRFQTFLRVEFPSALPYVLAGMEMGIVFAIIGAVVGEFLGGSSGLGYLAVATLNSFQVEQLFATIFILTAIGLALYLVVVGLRRLLIPWHESVRSPSGV